MLLHEKHTIEADRLRFTAQIKAEERKVLQQQIRQNKVNMFYVRGATAHACTCRTQSHHLIYYIYNLTILRVADSDADTAVGGRGRVCYGGLCLPQATVGAPPVRGGLWAFVLLWFLYILTSISLYIIIID